MPTMKPIRQHDWTPTQLVAPDGRTYTPGSYREHRQLLASGYVEAPQEQAAETTAEEPVETPAETAVIGTPVEQPAEAAAPEAATKPKTTRRTGGQQ